MITKYDEYCALLITIAKIEALDPEENENHVNIRKFFGFYCYYLQVLIYFYPQDKESCKYIRNLIFSLIKAEFERSNCRSLNVFDTLPEPVKHKILLKLDHLTLFYLAIAYPHLMLQIYRPPYWSHLATELDNYVFTSNDIILLAKSSNVHLKKLTLNLKWDKKNNDDVIREVFLNCLNIRELAYRANSVSFGVDMICSNLKSITYLDISIHDLDNDHVTCLTDNLKCLVSFLIQTENEIDDGLIYFLNNTKYLEVFGMFVPESSQKYAFKLIN